MSLYNDHNIQIVVLIQNIWKILHLRQRFSIISHVFFNKNPGLDLHTHTHTRANAYTNLNSPFLKGNSLLSSVGAFPVFLCVAGVLDIVSPVMRCLLNTCLEILKRSYGFSLNTL